jgi:hypothetical protein
MNTLTAEHIQALANYKAEHGKKWKERLSQAWFNDWREQWGVLREIRNQVGIQEAFEQFDMARPSTLADLRASLAEVGCTVRKDGAEYRVNFKGGSEATAYYTDDMQDARDTGHAMAARKVGQALRSIL